MRKELRYNLNKKIFLLTKNLGLEKLNNLYIKSFQIKNV